MYKTKIIKEDISMVKPLLLISLLSTLLLAERVQPIHMQAHDRPSYNNYNSSYHDHYYNSGYSNSYSNSYNNYNDDYDDDYDNDEYHEQYDQSTNRDSTEDRVISSTAEASAEITIVTTIEGVSEITSQTHNDHATMSFLENNRLQITEDIAHGEGEHLETLLTLMQIKEDEHTLIQLQKHLSTLLPLKNKDFLMGIHQTI